jgi:hypothetical protein
MASFALFAALPSLPLPSLPLRHRRPSFAAPPIAAAPPQTHCIVCRSATDTLPLFAAPLQTPVCSLSPLCRSRLFVAPPQTPVSVCRSRLPLCQTLPDAGKSGPPIAVRYRCEEASRFEYGAAAFSGIRLLVALATACFHLQPLRHGALLTQPRSLQPLSDSKGTATFEIDRGISPMTDGKLSRFDALQRTPNQ